MHLTIQRALQDVADRLDKIEGIRGGSSIASDLDMNSNNLKNVNSLAASSLSTTDLSADTATTGTSNADNLAVGNSTFDGSFELLTTFWDDMRMPATAINPPGLASDPDFDTTNGGWLFGATGTELLFLAVQIPHTWKEGTELRPHVHWQKTTSASGNVYWQFEYKKAPIGQVMDSAFTTLSSSTTMTATPDNNLAGEHLMTQFSTIDMTGGEISDMFLIKLSRIGGNSADTYGADVRLLEFDIHYESDGFGSLDIGTK